MRHIRFVFFGMGAGHISLTLFQAREERRRRRRKKKRRRRRRRKRRRRRRFQLARGSVQQDSAARFLPVERNQDSAKKKNQKWLNFAVKRSQIAFPVFHFYYNKLFSGLKIRKEPIFGYF